MLCPPALPRFPQPAAGDEMHLPDWVGRCQELLLPGGDKRTGTSRALETPCPNSLGSPKGHASRRSPATAVPSGSDQPVPETDLFAGIKEGGAAANPRCDARVICRGRVLAPTGPGGLGRHSRPVLCCAAARRYRSQAGPRSLIIVPWHSSLSNSSFFKTSLQPGGSPSSFGNPTLAVLPI